MNIAEYLANEAEDEARRIRNRMAALDAELREVEAKKAEIEAKRRLARGAAQRFLNYQPRIGPDYQCPCCWVRDEVRSTLSPIPGTDEHDIMRCRACGTDHHIPLG